MTETLTLQKCQDMVGTVMKKHGFDERSNVLQTMMMAEEMGEVAKAIRHIELKGATPENKQELALELADVLNYVCWLSSKNGIDLEKAFVEKFHINMERTW